MTLVPIQELVRLNEKELLELLRYVYEKYRRYIRNSKIVEQVLGIKKTKKLSLSFEERDFKKATMNFGVKLCNKEMNIFVKNLSESIRSDTISEWKKSPGVRQEVESCIFNECSQNGSMDHRKPW